MFNTQQFQQADKLLRNILLEQPTNSQALYALAQIALKFQAFEDALPLLRKCTELMPQHPQPLLQLAEVLAELLQTQQAKICYQQLISRFPEFPKGYFMYAGLLLACGEKTLAEVQLRKTLQLEPKNTRALLALSDVNKITTNDPLLAQMQSLLSELENTDKDRMAIMHLHYALGKACDDISNYPQAFYHWQAANKLQLKYCNFRTSQMFPFFAKLKIAFNKQLLSAKVNQPKSRLTPIFIVGMPRSGSTLLEQMLSSHSEINTAGEVNYIGSTVVKEIENITAKPYPQGLERLTPSQLNTAANNYLSKLQKHHPESEYIIDKMPSNYQSIGLIKLIFPNAIIIALSRNPVAISLSVFRNYFAENEPYFCDLEEFSEYYLAYADLMKHWKQSFDHNLIELSYESLIADPKNQLQNILSYCELSWQDSCLQYHQKQQQVLTISANQVNKPMYKTSLDHWKNYAQFLPTVMEKLSNPIE